MGDIGRLRSEVNRLRLETAAQRKELAELRALVESLSTRQAEMEQHFIEEFGKQVEGRARAGAAAGMAGFVAEVEAARNALEQQLANLHEVLNQVLQRSDTGEDSEGKRGIEPRPNFSAKELLGIYERQLEHYPDLTLRQFAENVGANYRTLVTERSRQNDTPRPKKRRK